MRDINRYMSKIIGNSALKSHLCNDIMTDSLSHAYILEGPTGSGRHTVALMTAAALSCENKNDTSMSLPCCACDTCKKILEGKSPDVIVQGTEDKASIGVDIARFLREDVHTLPNDLEHKVYIIEDADKMTVQAQNALLLTLEEPPSFAHFFLLCNNSASLLETIKSRAPVLRTEPVSDEQIDRYICEHDRRAAQLKISSPEEYREIVRAADGGIGRALELLEPRRWKPVRDMRRLIDSFVFDIITKQNSTKMFIHISAFSTKRDILSEQLLMLLCAVRDLILLKKSDNVKLKFYTSADYAIDLCDRVSLAFLFDLQDAINCAIDENKRNANVKLLLTKMLLSANLI